MSDDVSFAIEAKSDQLNTLDIVGVEPVQDYRRNSQATRH